MKMFSENYACQVCGIKEENAPEHAFVQIFDSTEGTSETCEEKLYCIKCLEIANGLKKEDVAGRDERFFNSEECICFFCEKTIDSNLQEIDTYVIYKTINEKYYKNICICEECYMESFT